MSSYGFSRVELVAVKESEINISSQELLKLRFGNLDPFCIDEIVV